MAILYNEVDLDRAQINAEKKRNASWSPFIPIGGFGVAISLALFMGTGNIIFIILLVFSCFLGGYFESQSKKDKQTTGASYHRSIYHDVFVKKINETFSNEYQALFSVYIQEKNNNLKSIDCLLVGPTGVFIIDFSSANGKIEAKKNSNKWPLAKTGRDNGRYMGHPISNPIKSLNYRSMLLQKGFQQYGFKVWVDNYYMFVDCQKLTTDASNVLSDFSKLKKQIENRERRLNNQQISAIVQIVTSSQRKKKPN